jgi:FtsZ-interacting cell division protein YlmF
VRECVRERERERKREREREGERDKKRERKKRVRKRERERERKRERKTDLPRGKRNNNLKILTFKVHDLFQHIGLSFRVDKIFLSCYVRYLRRFEDYSLHLSA